MGYRGVQIKRDVKRLCPFENRPEPLVIEKNPVGEAVHQSTLEAEPGDGALELVGRGGGIGCGNRGKGGKPVRMRTNRLVEPVIGPAR